MELNYLCNFGKGHYEENLCEIFNLEQWFRKHLFKIFFLFLALEAIMFGIAEPILCNFDRGHYIETFV